MRLQVRDVSCLCLDEGLQPGNSHMCRLLRLPAGRQAMVGPLQTLQRCLEHGQLSPRHLSMLPGRAAPGGPGVCLVLRWVPQGANGWA